jgi:hypothetical protein
VICITDMHDLGHKLRPPAGGSQMFRVFRSDCARSFQLVCCFFVPSLLKQSDTILLWLSNDPEATSASLNS